MLQRWEEGCQSGRRLWLEIRKQDYAASLTSVHGLSARQAAFLVLRPVSERSPEETVYLDHLCRLDPEIAQATELATTFLTLVRERPSDRRERQRQVDDWLAYAVASTCSSLHRFAQGLQSDYDAVLAGLRLPTNNGQLEGQVNQLKAIKRQMFGRAKFDLLRLQDLYAA